MKQRVRGHLWTTQNSHCSTFSPPNNTRSIVPKFGPYASRIARRSHARVRERPLQSAVGTLILHTHYVHALRQSAKYSLFAVTQARETVHTRFALCQAAYSCSKLQGYVISGWRKGAVLGRGWIHRFEKQRWTHSHSVARMRTWQRGLHVEKTGETCTWIYCFQWSRILLSARYFAYFS